MFLGPHRVLPLLTLTLTVSAFLLFLIEPMIGKYVLPYFGGGSSVWSACLLFFTIFLLLGYGYGTGIARLGVRRAMQVHLGVLLCGAFVMALSWYAIGQPLLPLDLTPYLGAFSDPTLGVISILMFLCGIPFFVLSSTSTVMQYAATKLPDADAPYRLYAYSNLASLAGLLLYPVFLEPFFSLHTLSFVVGMLLIAFFLLYAYVTGVVLRHVPDVLERTHKEEGMPLSLFASTVFYAGFPAGLLLATTATITRDIAPMPLFWVIPLALYLLSYAMAFGLHPFRPMYAYLAGGCAFVALLLSYASLPPFVLVVVYLLAFASMTHLSHLRLYAIRPPKDALPLFYLAVSVGGALGTLVLAFAVPLLLTYPLEFPLLLLLGIVIALRQMPIFQKLRDNEARLIRSLLPLILLVFVLSVALVRTSLVVEMSRNFYGALVVVDGGDEYGAPMRYFAHGDIIHGTQFRDEARAHVPTTYFSHESAVGRVLLHQASSSPALHVGVTGLGVGTLGAYCRTEDQYDFFEINPGVVALAEQSFTYLDDCLRARMMVGDARLEMVRLSKEEPDMRYDTLIIDAFSGDAVPVHLLTKEAFALYLSLLRTKESVMLVHVSNKYLELAPVVIGGAQALSMDALYVVDTPEIPSGHRFTQEGKTVSRWVVIGHPDSAILSHMRTTSGVVVHPEAPSVWTDDKSNVLSVVKWQWHP
jgi:hypothetical protein